MYESFRKTPFYLNDQAIEWVSKTYSELTLEQKVGQLFNLMILNNSDEELSLVKLIQPGGITKFIVEELDSEVKIMNQLRDHSNLPLLVSGDLEGGGMSFSFGAQVPNQLGLAGLKDERAVEYCTQVIAQESKLLGFNWSFTPVIDINAKFRSAIVGTRSYGSDVDIIERMSRANITTFQNNGIAATAKHWPGEGFDDRDQHLVTTVNPLNMLEWEERYGRLYRSAIECNVMSIMSAHIALPEYVKSHDDNPEEWWRPASVSKLLNEKLLRGELGFNGLIVSDATTMAGVSGWAKREDVVAEIIENGCDMLLFCKDPVEDYAFMLKAVREGRVSEARLEQSVLRILAMKAALGLQNKPEEISVDKFNALLASDYADKISELNRRTVHLVKNRNDILPISLDHHKRVLIISTGLRHTFVAEPLPLSVASILRNEGFQVTEFHAGMALNVNDYDWVLYLSADESMLLKSHIYIDWMALQDGFVNATYRPWVDIPTVMVSFGHPYLLYDAPKAPVYINAYSPLLEVQQAVVDGLLGRLSFNTDAAIDPFCGLEQLRY
ncbi:MULTISPECIES: glycoside hydrolase family 3 protein [Marinomonas]|uniref:beta-N-acetylhexosaminidase n=1 Tax=Marinomonas arctica TaxID=383750 RepID=A0A7H1J2K7_9GAMM|nr:MULTISPECIES: glycoside hydrolase family 3 N-terminal domain-containing protein [Marinomonas]MCS7486440.1 beta-hexosaminidase [Marinomonas sp. BSi20414]QNT04723.1 glycoside hydrolase family 3 protein [Marinomonas arctica]GGN30456.1 glycoside hydrolase family 3 [Marinomonas arctica]